MSIKSSLYFKRLLVERYELRRGRDKICNTSFFPTTSKALRAWYLDILVPTVEAREKALNLLQLIVSTLENKSNTSEDVLNIAYKCFKITHCELVGGIDIKINVDRLETQLLKKLEYDGEINNTTKIREYYRGLIPKLTSQIEWRNYIINKMKISGTPFFVLFERDPDRELASRLDYMVTGYFRPSYRGALEAFSLSYSLVYDLIDKYSDLDDY